MEDFKREPRYIVLKIKDIKTLSPEHQEQLHNICVANNASRQERGKAPFDSVVIESDWSCYDMAWHLVETEASEYHKRKMEIKDNASPLTDKQKEELSKL